MVTAVPLSVRCQIASSHAISSRLVLTQIALLKSNHNKTTVLNCDDTHNSDLALWLLFHWWFFCQKTAGALLIPVLTLTLCLISSKTGLLQGQLFVCILRFNHLSSAVFRQCIMVHSLWRICLWNKDVGLLFSFVGPVDNSSFLSRTKYMPLCP